VVSSLSGLIRITLKLTSDSKLIGARLLPPFSALQDGTVLERHSFRCRVCPARGSERSSLAREE